MNCLYVYSTIPGNGKITKHLPYIEKRLQKIFKKVTILEAKNLTELVSYAKSSSKSYEVLIFSGGDGTFHHIINAVSKIENRPILGYLPSGTLNDFGKNFGFSRNLKRSLDIIEKQNITAFDVGRVNDDFYFAHLVANGVFSNISYETKRDKIRAFGKLSYYFKATFAALSKKKYRVQVKFDDQVITKETPFIMLFNSSHVAGFKVNKNNFYDDGFFHLYIPKVGFFNGLYDFFLCRKRLQEYKVRDLTIEGDFPFSWCLDGEEFKADKIQITLLDKHLRIFRR